MKTLDEVIKALDICRNPDIHRICKDCPMPDSQRCIEVLQTYALHYLKEYRNCGDCAYADSYLRCTAEDRNDPLTWDELQTMEGKPVWVEAKQGFIDFRGWILIERTAEVDMLCLTAEPHSEFIVDGDDIGYTWNAYRKERHVD